MPLLWRDMSLRNVICLRRDMFAGRTWVDVGSFRHGVAVPPPSRREAFWLSCEYVALRRDMPLLWRDMSLRNVICLRRDMFGGRTGDVGSFRHGDAVPPPSRMEASENKKCAGTLWLAHYFFESVSVVPEVADLSASISARMRSRSEVLFASFSFLSDL